MIQKKVCLLGGYAVGKTSLVRRFVKGIFSEKYLTTVGVKIDKKVVKVGGHEISLILWDLHGEDDFQHVQMTYMRGASGYLLVVDGTRRESLETAGALQARTEEVVGKIPFVLLLNKADLRDEWELEGWEAGKFARKDCAVLQTSAKTGQGVEEAFLLLAGKMLEEQIIELPSPILHYLCAFIVRNRSLAYLLVGKDGVLLDTGGALSAYGLQQVRTGERPGKELFFLEGFLPLAGEPVYLPRLKTGPGLSADIHIFTGDAGDWILLLDATLEETCERLLQQCTNDLGLLRRQREKRWEEKTVNR